MWPDVFAVKFAIFLAQITSWDEGKKYTEDVRMSFLTSGGLSCWRFSVMINSFLCLSVCLLPYFATSFLLCKQFEFETWPPPGRMISLLWWEAGLISLPNSHHTCKKIEGESWGWGVVVVGPAQVIPPPPPPIIQGVSLNRAFVGRYYIWLCVWLAGCLVYDYVSHRFQPCVSNLFVGR